MGTGFPDGFTTARLCAERLTPDHLTEVRRMHGDAAVMGLLGGVRDEARTVEYFARNLRHWDDHGFGLWILRERSGGAPIGRAVLRHVLIEDVDEVEVGYAFYQPYWGRGLATEVANVCVAFADRELHLASVVGVTSPENRASQQVLCKAGLVYERDFMQAGEPSSLFRRRFR
jgi:RimJ/RimL family protein N-acetyltransferase